MLFSFVCPTCKGKLEADASQSGAQASCPQCGNLVAVPESRVDTGTTLAGFRLERRLGKGGMGEVFLARQLSVDRLVAVKVLPPGFAADEHAVARFLHEGRLAARLDHRHTVRVHEAGEDSGNYYLAMAYVEGESLDRRLERDGRMPEAEALAAVRAVADALAYAWEEFQLLHRDLKPANIMLDRRGRVFLMDLGLAKSLGSDEGLTLSGTIVGTPQYMSPEQAQGFSELTFASDIYSLGVTLYHLVAGVPPFTGKSALEILQHHVHTAPCPPAECNPALSDGCSRLIVRMMAKKPEDRHPEWRALLADLDVLLGSAPPSSAAVSAPVPAEPAAKIPPQAAARKQAPRAKSRLWRVAFAAAGALLALLLAVFLLRGRGGRVAATERTVEPVPVPAPVAAVPQVPDPPPPAPARQPVHGEAWTVPEVGMEMLPVEPGHFLRFGYLVRVTRPFWLGKHEVTQAEYKALTGAVPGWARGDRYPVDSVSWREAMACCRILGERERAAGRLPEGYEYRLPTEAEWEYAHRAGSRGDLIDNLDEVAWHAGNSEGKTQPVGGKKPNAWGFHDMAGNVYEFCCDFHDPDYPRQAPADDPVNLRPTARCVIRGCACYDGGRAIENRSFRYGVSPQSGSGGIGFRVCLGPEIGALRWIAERPSGDRLSLPHTGDWRLAFDGKESQVAVPTLTWTPREPLTLETVFAWSGGDNALLAGSGGPGGLWLEVREDVLWARSGGEDGGAVGATLFFAKGRRIHAAAVRDGGELRLYMNGRRVTSQGPVPTDFADLGATEFAIGRDGEHAFKGSIETLRVSKTARYTADFALEQILPLKPDADTLCLLDCEEGEGDAARDRSGNGHHGRIRDATWEPMWPCPLSEERLRTFRAALRAANPAVGDLDFRVSGYVGDTIWLDLSGNSELRVLTPLADLPVAMLDLGDTGAKDLSPLRGLPLRSLNLTGTPVADLSPLRGMPLHGLSLSRTQVKDLSPLAGLPLLYFACYSAALEDLSPLAGCPLRILTVTGCQVQSLPVFTARRLQLLRLDGSPLSDLSPLAGLPLLAASLVKTGVTDLSPLRSCPDLNWIGVSDPLEAEKVAALLPKGVAVAVNPSWGDFAATEAYRRVRAEIREAMHRP